MVRARVYRDGILIMTETQKIVQQWFDHLAVGDAQAAFALFADDIVFDIKGTTPVSGVYKGLDQLISDFFTPWRKQIDGDLTVTADELIGEGERVVALAKGAAKTVFGTDYNNDYVFIFTVKGGQIAEVVEYCDTALIETAAYGRKIVEGDS